MTEQPEGLPPTTFRQSARVLGLVSAGHALSSFYILCLPPLIPYLKDDFQVSYALLGLMLSAQSITTGVLQLPVGFLVDRIGGKHVLSAGLVLMAASFGLVALVPNVWWTLPLMALFGVGVATIRPSNYTILNASIPPAWIGRSFGINMFAGHMGRALAPPLVVTAAALWGWRWAVLLAAAFGIATCIAVLAQWRIIRDDSPRKRKDHAPGFIDEIRLLASRSILLFFLFYLLQSLVNNGIHTFSVAALAELHATPLAVASGALTGYLIATALGVLAGGFLVDKTARHELVAAIALLCSAACLIALGTVSLPIVVIVGVMVMIGIFQGTVRPARDMMIRDLLPRESFGKAISMVATGAAIGAAVAPVAFGWIMDIGQAQWVFYLLAACLVLVVATVLIPKQRIAMPKSSAGQERDARS